MNRVGKVVSVLLVASGILSLALLAATCSCERTPPSPLELPEKGNPKLDSQLDQLVRAEMRGEAASFAQQSNIELVDGGVRVIIECLPGQVDAVIVASTTLGASFEASYGNLVQAVVPVTSLTALADTANIRFIRLPQRLLPG